MQEERGGSWRRVVDIATIIAAVVIVAALVVPSA